jgi:hypothetical protein
MLSPPFIVEPGSGVRDNVCLAVQWLSGFGVAIPRVEAPPQGEGR